MFYHGRHLYILVYLQENQFIGYIIGMQALLYEKKPLSARFHIIWIYLAINGRKLVICHQVVTMNILFGMIRRIVFSVEKQPIIHNESTKMALKPDRVVILYA